MQKALAAKAEGHSREAQQPAAPRAPRLAPDQIAIVAEVIESLRCCDARTIPEQALAGTLGWQLADAHEVIPYGTVFLSDAPPTMDDLRWAQAVAREHGWLSTV